MGIFDALFGSRRPPPEPPEDPVSRVLGRAHGEQVPFHLGAAIAFADGGPDPLDAVSIYQVDEGPRPAGRAPGHFHYVSFGMEETGCALTFRLAARPGELARAPGPMGSLAHGAPIWPVKMLNMLARRVHRTHRLFGEGHWWEGAPGVLRPHTELHHLAFARDPELGVVDVDGRPRLFLQAVLVGPETIDAMKQDERLGRGDATIDALRAADPLLVSRA